MLISDSPCLFCLNTSTARLGLDKKGRPFFHCVGCGARSFLPSFSPGLNGIALLTPFVRAISEEMATTREGYDRHSRTIASFLGEIRARRTLGAGAQATAGGDAARASVVIPIRRPA
jgi:hypothetical protein